MKGKIRIVIRRFALALILIVAISAVFVAGLLVFRPVIDLTSFKAAFETPLTAFMETPVSVSRVLVKPGLWADIQLEGVSVEAAGHGEGSEFAHIDRVTLDLAVMPLFDNQVRLRKLIVEGAAVDVRKMDDGTGNWPVWTEFTYEIAELSHISVTETTIGYLDEGDGRRHRVVIDRFESDVGDETPLRMALDGSADEFRFSLRSEGPTFREMRTRDTWPQDLSLKVAGFTVELEGLIGGTLESPIFEMGFRFRSDDLSELAELLEQELPISGAVDLAGNYVASDWRFTLDRMIGTVSGTDVESSLELDLTSETPRVVGHLDLDAVDVSRWSGQGGPVVRMDGHDDPVLDGVLPLLEAVDARIDISLARLATPRGAVESIEIGFELEDGALTLPFSARVDGQPVQGRFAVNRDDDLPHLEIDLTAEDVELGEVSGGRAAGRIHRLTAEVESRGSTIPTILNGMDLRVRADGIRGSVVGVDTKSIDIPIRSIAIVQPPGEGLWASLRGRYAGESLAVEIGTVGLVRVLEGGALPVYASVRRAGVRGTARGRVDPTREPIALHLRFSVSGETVEDLHPWIDVSPDTGLPFLVTGRIDTSRKRTRLVIEDGRIASSEVKADLLLGDQSADIPFNGWIESTRLNLEELLTIVQSDHDSEGGGGISIHDRVIPSETAIPDMDLEIRVGRVIYRDINLGDLSIELKGRDGSLATSPFGFQWEQQPIEGWVRLDLLGSVPEADLVVFTEQLDLREAARRFDLGSLPETLVGKVDLELELRGSTLDEINRRSYASLAVEDLRTTTLGDDPEERWEIVIDWLQADALYGEPTRATATGSINQTPVEMTIGFSFDELASLLGEGTPVEIDVVSGETRAGLSGLLALPFDAQDMDFLVLLSGETLGDLGPILHLDLPSIGPYSIDGRLTTAEGNVDLSNIDLVVGESEFRGEIGFFEGEERPIITGRLAGHRPRLEDFYPSSPVSAETGAHETAAGQSTDDEVHPVIDPEMAMSIDADLSLDVTGLEWGDRGPGSGEFRFRLDDGHLAASVHWDQPQGGTINARLDLDVVGESYDAVLNADIDHMSYGPLRPLFAFEGGEGGVLSLDTRLRGRGATLEDWLLSSEGHLDFTTYPESHHTAIFNLWGGQLIDVLLPLFHAEEEQTKLNCTVGELDFADGVITPRKLVLDSSRSRIRGKGLIDLSRNTIDLKLSPRPKRRGFLSLATPINIEGALDDPSISVNTGGLAVTALRVYSWFLTVWFELFKKPLPMDGSDICVDPPSRAVFEDDLRADHS